MKKISVLLSILLLTASLINAVEIADEIELPVIDGWIINAAEDTYPIQIISPTEDAELLIFKSVLPEEKTIIDNYTFKRAVDQVIQDIILTLPEGQVRTNTGYFEENYLKFDIDFISHDSLSNQTINHRLVGFIYSHPDGFQYLFSLWGKTTSEATSINLDEIAYMQDNFNYFGEQSASVFEKKFSNIYTVIGFVMVFLVVFLLYMRRRRTHQIDFSKESNFWRCSCGRQNHINYELCKRCGQPQKKILVKV